MPKLLQHFPQQAGEQEEQQQQEEQAEQQQQQCSSVVTPKQSSKRDVEDCIDVCFRRAFQALERRAVTPKAPVWTPSVASAASTSKRDADVAFNEASPSHKAESSEQHRKRLYARVEKFLPTELAAGFDEAVELN